MSKDGGERKTEEGGGGRGRGEEAGVRGLRGEWERERLGIREAQALLFDLQIQRIDWEGETSNLLKCLLCPLWTVVGKISTFLLITHMPVLTQNKQKRD